MIRYAQAADYDSMEAILQEVRQPHVAWRPDVYKPTDTVYPKEYFASLIAENRLLAAEQEGTVVGLPAYRYRHTETDKQVPGNVIFVEDLAVKTEYRGRGIGTRLLTWVKEKVLAQHLDGLELQVNARNTAARAMYERFGFTEKSVNLCTSETHKKAGLWLLRNQPPAFSIPVFPSCVLPICAVNAEPCVPRQVSLNMRQ